MIGLRRAYSPKFAKTLCPQKGHNRQRLVYIYQNSFCVIDFTAFLHRDRFEAIMQFFNLNKDSMLTHENIFQQPIRIQDMQEHLLKITGRVVSFLESSCITSWPTLPR